MNRKQQAVRLACRGTRHWMQHVPPRADWTRPTGGWWGRAWAVMHFECQRDGCEVWRHDAIDRNGGLVARKYDVPDWYRLSEEEERPTADQLRLWMLEDEVGQKRGVRRAS